MRACLCAALQAALGISTAEPAKVGTPGGVEEVAPPVFVPEPVDKRATLSRKQRAARERSGELEEVTKAALSEKKKRFSFWQKKG